MKKVWLLFPCSPLQGINEVDENFMEEYFAAKAAGFKTFLFDHDRL